MSYKTSFRYRPLRFSGFKVMGKKNVFAIHSPSHNMMKSDRISDSNSSHKKILSKKSKKVKYCHQYHQESKWWNGQKKHLVFSFDNSKEIKQKK